MSDFSPIDSAFEGFRIIRDKPSAVLGWVLFGVLWILLLIGGVVLTLLPHLAELRQALRPLGGTRDWERLAAIFLPATLLGFLFSSAVYATLKSAIYRAVLHPDWKGLSHLSLGKHELYVFLSELAAMALLIAYYGVVFAALVALTSGMPETLSILIRVPVGMAAFAGWIWWSGRLGLAKVASYSEDRTSVFDTWTMSKGPSEFAVVALLILFGLIFVATIAMTYGLPLIFGYAIRIPVGVALLAAWVRWSAPRWPLLTTFVLSGVLGAIVFAIGLFIAVKIVQAAGLTYAAGEAKTLAEAAIGLGKALIALVLNTIALVVSYTITIAPTARAYQRIKAAGAAPPAVPVGAEPATA